VRAVFGLLVLLVLLVLLATPVARAEPEGYRGGEGRAPGTPYVSGGVSLTVRGVVVKAAPHEKWSCGGRAVKPTGRNLVTILLAISNPTDEPLSMQLPNMDLVVDSDHRKRVEEGACARNGGPEVTDVSLAAHHGQTVRVRFLVPRREVAKILVYNDDDFPALFALPAATTKARAL